MRHLTYCLLGILWASAIVACGADHGEEQGKSEGRTPGSVPESEVQSLDTDTSETVYHTVDDVQLIPVLAEGVDRLTAEAQEQLYLAYRESVKTEKSHYDHNGSMVWRIRGMLEQILSHSSGLSPQIKRKIKPYMMQYWLHKGPVHSITKEPIRPLFIPGELGAATQVALQNGAAIDTSDVVGTGLAATRLEELEGLLRLVRPIIFHETPPQTEVNTTATDSAPASPKQPHRPSIQEDSSQLNANEDPVSDSVPEMIVGFEQGPWKSIIKELEKRAPAIDKRIRQVGGKKSTASRAQTTPVQVETVVSATGGAGPIWKDNTQLYGMGPTVPGSSTRGRRYFINLDDAFDVAVGQILRDEFSSTPTVAKRRAVYRSNVRVAYWILRHMFGHGLDGTETKPAGWLNNRIGSSNPTIDALRADLAVLFLIYDQDVHGVSLLSKGEALWAFWDEYVTSTLTLVAAGTDFSNQPSLLARLVIINYLVEKGVLSIAPDDTGRVSAAISDYSALKPVVMDFLKEVRRIRFVGDGPTATAIIRDYGRVPPIWAEDLQKRFEHLSLAGQYAFIYPLLRMGSKPGAPAVLELMAPKRFFDRQLAFFY